MSGLSKHAPKSQLNPSARDKSRQITQGGKYKEYKKTEQLLKDFFKFVFADVLVSGCLYKSDICRLRKGQKIKLRMTNRSFNGLSLSR